MKVLLLLGNQLFSPKYIQDSIKDLKELKVFMREDFELCTYYRFHKHKIIFFLSAMRRYSEELQDFGISVHYEKLRHSDRTYEEHLLEFIKDNQARELIIFEIEDKFFERRILNLSRLAGISIKVLKSPMFLTSRQEFKSYLEASRRPFMKTFYQQRREKLGVLIDSNGQPTGGQWSFDTENRKPLPKGKVPPSPMVKLDLDDQNLKPVITLVDECFSNHPGVTKEYWIPFSRKAAEDWFKLFLKTRLSEFGPYEDALSDSSPFIFHSVLTPFLNSGLLTPDTVISKTLEYGDQHKIPLSSLEGFIRQVMGWREFIRGIYQNYSERQDELNFWDHERKLSHHWWSGNTGIPPLDDVIRKVIRYGYAHHIERLMVIGSLMLLLEVKPKYAHQWFMEMFIDSSDWVMGPNVYGMALFSDGGIFATKPYVCGSNYYRKMGHYPVGNWCSGVDGLYWRFLDKNQDKLKKNPRMSMILNQLKKMSPAKKMKIYTDAEELIDRLTIKS